MEMAFVVEKLVADLETIQPDVAAKEVEKIRQLLGDVFDEMHLLFASRTTNSKRHRPSLQKNRPDA